MPEQKCKICGRTILRAKSRICYYCWNKEAIEKGAFKPAPSKRVPPKKK